MTPDMTDLSELIERVEKATGPDRELDTCLWLKFTPGATRRVVHVKHAHSPAEWDIDETREASGQLITVPAYTASLDAALALADRVLPGCWWMAAKGRLRASEPLYGARLFFGTDEAIGEAEHEQSAALAIVLALLKALSQEPQTGVARSCPAATGDPIAPAAPDAVNTGKED